MAQLRFAKMHGLGNDFMVVDAVRQTFAPDAATIRRLADRRFGIGFDQLLVVEAADEAQADFRYRIFNADGGEVEQCGNGARCFVRFVREQGLTDKTCIRVQTQAGLITLQDGEDGLVRVNMGAPVFAPERIPFLTEQSAARVQPLALPDGGEVLITALSMGNPHAVQVVADVAHAPLAVQGPQIEQHARFPARVNAGFMQIIDRQHIALRVHERGAGETLACGTGACAAAVAGIVRGLLDTPVRVDMRGGTLEIDWHGEGEPVWMRGEAHTVFVGELPWPCTLAGRPHNPVLEHTT